MRIITISSKKQITLPSEILVSLGLRPKDKLLLEKDGDNISLKPLPESIAGELAGCLTKYVDPSKLGVSFEIIRKETQKKVAKYIANKK